MKKFQTCKLCAALSACGLLTALPAMAAQLTLAQAPAGSVTVVPPPPNLILTLDNSGSMSDNKDGQTLSRFDNLKAALVTAFSSANVPANSIRLGWNTLNDWTKSKVTYSCSSFSSTANSCGAQGNIVRPLTETHRANFINWVNNVFSSTGSTPTHNAYQKALSQFDIAYTNVNSPWAEVPGTEVGDYLTCRKSYVMLLTDGEYNVAQTTAVKLNSSNDLDSVTRTLGDGKTPYPPADSNSANIYKQTQSSSTTYSNTLADLAFHYWAKDADSIASNNNVKTLERITQSENGIEPFWNPKNDPATWQHVSTYTIGYGTTASGWATSPKMTAGETLYDSADLKKLMLGTLSWPNNTWSTQHKYMEMMHMAINGRGKFYPATSQEELVAALKDLLVDVGYVPEEQVTSATGSTLSAYSESTAFYTSYDSEKWSGDVTAVTLKAQGGVNTASKPWGDNTAASLLDARTASGRAIFTSQINLTGSVPAWTGSTFAWANLSTDQQTDLRGTATVDTTTTALGTGRLSYLRGDRTGEGTTYRERKTVLGDIVNSNVWFMKGVPNAGYPAADYLDFTQQQQQANRTDALFVGANDGMLHAFDADDGQELFAYVPLGAYANLASLTSTTYSHKYFVDGSPFTADYCKAYTGTACSTWGTALVGFMGAGGKGFFMLDVTDPTSMSASKVLMDTTTGYLPGSKTADPDIGYITQKAVTEKGNLLATRQISRMNNGKWALVTGNGYNSTDEKAVLIIQYLDGSTPKKIYATTTAGLGNGLSAPRLIDLNGDGLPDVAYAGDLKGNLYKFDLASTDASNWGVAGGKAMFTSVNDSGAVQPITTAPVYQVHPTKGLMVVFGTGQSLTVADRSDISVQSFYGLYDFGFSLDSDSTKAYKAGGVTVAAPADMSQTTWNPLPGTRSSAMLKQTINSAGTITSRALDVAADGVDEIGTTYRGWYLDLPLERERVVRNPRWFDGDLLDLLSDIPAVAPVTSNPCDAVDTSPAAYYTTVLNAVTGNAPAADVWADTTGINRAEGELGAVETRTNTASFSTCVGTDCDSSDPEVRKLLGRYFKAPSWRQMQ
ncbi:MAG: PilC/PilY family type IV pilus protein [Ottowia sp.]|uniref:PilC/PilY family type IV pilus protein n=1 Tax=Ottowia sp. TaxID=1898956 RepID=UPI0039E6A076